MKNIQKSEFQELVEKIVAENFPDEITAFHLYFDDQFSSLINGENILKKDSKDKGEFEFGESIIEVMQFLAVMAGTLKAVLELQKIIKSSKHVDKNKINESWKLRLIEAGIDEKEADNISNKFFSDINKFL